MGRGKKKETKALLTQASRRRQNRPREQIRHVSGTGSTELVNPSLEATGPKHESRSHMSSRNRSEVQPWQALPLKVSKQDARCLMASSRKIERREVSGIESMYLFVPMVHTTQVALRRPLLHTSPAREADSKRGPVGKKKQKKKEIKKKKGKYPKRHHAYFFWKSGTH